MKKLVLFLALSLSVSACNKHNEKETVYHTQDGHYYKQDSSGEWLLFYMLMSSNRDSSAPYVSQGVSRSLPTGVWSKAPSSPSPKEINEAEEEEVSESVHEENEVGESETESNESSDAGSSDTGSESGGSE